MNETEDYSVRHAPPAKPPSPALECPSKASDERVIGAMHEYLAAVEAGRKPDRVAFLACFPDIAAELSDCLDGLEFVRGAASQLSGAGSSGPTKPDAAGAVLQPEGPLGDYRLVREIGRGGMGVVYEAVQISLGRRVAVKVLPFASTFDKKQLQRFHNEAQAAA